MTSLRLRLHETCFVQFWPHRKPLPEGATVLADMQDCHHGFHAVLIMLSPDPRLIPTTANTLPPTD